jgi:hypothetical protein
MQAPMERGSYSFLTTALDRSEWPASRTDRALPGPPVTTGYEAKSASKLVLTQRLKDKSFASAGDRTPVVQSVVRHYTD